MALIPIQAFREIAFAMCVGLLLDTLIARTLLIPALVSLFGRGRHEDEKPTDNQLSTPPIESSAKYSEFRTVKRFLAHFADVAQLVEHFTRNEGVTGSNPGVGFPVATRTQPSPQKGGATPQPHWGTGASATTSSASGSELWTARREPHSA